MTDSESEHNCSAQQPTIAARTFQGQSAGVAASSETATFWPITWPARILFIPSAIAIILVRCYQKILSPVLGRTCRFHPSCSQYYIMAVRKYGLLSGTWRGFCRIARCHPWHPGGYDPP